MAFKSILGAVCACLMVVSFSANSALVSRLGGLAYYDDVADLTWSQDASIFVASNWSTTATNMLTLNIGGVTGWRLPTADLSCGNSTICDSSELGNMFHNVLGGTTGTTLLDSHNANYNLFTGVLGFNWTSDEYAADPFFGIAYSFWGSTSGKQSLNNKSYSRGGWAVQSGDVSAVPIPAAIWLLGSALLGLIGVAKRKKA